MKTVAVIGKNFGDEGKGLVTASLSLSAQNSLIVKHNGGAQAGHTVENEQTGKRFIHHQIASGAEYGAVTLLSETFCPDLYQLKSEIGNFKKLFGFIPKIYSEENVCITTIDDVLLNMAVETLRADNRHGSCGMGINECRNRINSGYALTVRDIANHNTDWIFRKLRTFRHNHTFNRLQALCGHSANRYTDLLSNENVLINFAEEIKKNVSLIKPVNADKVWLESFDKVIFESGQGLLLDEDYLKYAPHLTTSKTGLTNIVAFLSKRNIPLNEVIYVARTYVTRHGAGPLPYECNRNDLTGVGTDFTNEPNEWQGIIRYAKYESIASFLEPVNQDINIIKSNQNITLSLAITHLDETQGKLYFDNQAVDIKNFRDKISNHFDNIYELWSKNPCEIQ